MSESRKPIKILMADDDPDDRFMAQEALEEAGLKDELYFAENGEELVDFLLRRGRFSDPEKAPRPDLILLDLNMPRKSGREALAEIKSDPDLEWIPVVVLTTSKAEEDVMRTCALGVDSFITKPFSFDGLVEVMKNLSRYGCEIVALPDQRDA